jgi:hypothetical protein
MRRRGAGDMAGKAATVAVESSESERDTRSEIPTRISAFRYREAI